MALGFQKGLTSFLLFTVYKWPRRGGEVGLSVSAEGIWRKDASEMKNLTWIRHRNFPEPNKKSFDEALTAFALSCREGERWRLLREPKINDSGSGS